MNQSEMIDFFVLYKSTYKERLVFMIRVIKEKINLSELENYLKQTYNLWYLTILYL
jgi:hypothetical protein